MSRAAACSWETESRTTRDFVGLLAWVTAPVARDAMPAARSDTCLVQATERELPVHRSSFAEQPALSRPGYSTRPPVRRSPCRMQFDHPRSSATSTAGAIRHHAARVDLRVGVAKVRCFAARTELCVARVRRFWGRTGLRLARTAALVARMRCLVARTAARAIWKGKHRAVRRYHETNSPAAGQ